MRPRSNSAIAPRMCSWSFPAGVVASMPLCKADERDSKRVQIIEKQDQVTEIPSETIEPPDEDSIEAPTARGLDHRVERRAALLRAADSAIDVFLVNRPAARFRIAPKLLKLVVGVLVERGNARVNGDSHECEYT
jgi:hypothetical protein